MQDVITAQFPIGRLTVASVANVLIFTAVGWIAVMLPVLLLIFHFRGPLYVLPAPVRNPIFIGAALPGFLFSLWFAKREINKGRWQLTNSELFRGIYGQQKFPLDSIEKIIVGLPQTNAAAKLLQRAKPGTALGTTVDVLSAIQPILNTARNVALANAVKDNSLLICFKDGSWLPLRLIVFPNGKALMDGLRERCEDRVIESYNFSPDELKRLRRRDPNELIPAPNK